MTKAKIAGCALWGFLMTYVALIGIGICIAIITFFFWDADSDQRTQRQIHNSIVTNSTAQILITFAWLASAYWGGSRALRKTTEEKKKITILLASALVFVFVTWQAIVVEVTYGKFMISIFSVPCAIMLGTFLSLLVNQRKDRPNQTSLTTPDAPRPTS